MSQKPKLPLDCKKLGSVSCLFEGGRIAVEPIIALYLFSFGLSVNDYATVKATNIAVYFLLDIPLAFLLNQLGERRSVIVGISCAMIGSMGYALFHSLLGFCLSEIFLAMSVSIFNPSSSSVAIRILEKYPQKGLDARFFHILGSVLSFVILVTGIVGGTAFGILKQSPFLIYFMLNAFGLWIFSTIQIEEKVEQRKLIPSIPRSTWRELAPFIPIAVLLYSLTDPLAVYWQPLLVEKFAASSNTTTLFFAIYSIAYSLLALLISRLIGQEKIETKHVLMVLPITGGLFYFLFPLSTGILSLTALFAICWACSEITITSVTLQMRRAMPTDQRLFLGKVMSLFFRLGSIVAIASSKHLISFGWSVENLMQFYGKIALAVSVLCFTWSVSKLYKPHTQAAPINALN